MAEFTTGVFTPAAKAPHPYRPVVEDLLRRTEEDDPNSVIFFTAKDEAELTSTLRKLAAAAKEIDRSTIRRGTTENADGTFTVAVGIRAKVTRKRKTETDDSAVIVEGDAKPKGKGK